MESRRKAELDFLIRSKTPVAIIESRTNPAFEEDIYDDFYTLQELVATGHLEYIGHQDNYFYMRPKSNFPVYVVDEVRDLEAGTIVKLYLTSDGKDEFERWLETQV